MRMLLKNDTIVAIGNSEAMNGPGTVEIPEALSGISPNTLQQEYRWNGSTLIPLRGNMPNGGYYIDEYGTRHIEKFRDSWVQLQSDPDEPLVKKDGTWVLVSSLDQLIEKKEIAKIIIDRQAETTRSKYITSGDGQLATYLAQEAEAKLVLSYDPAEIPSDLETPYLTALIGVMGDSLIEVATVVAATAKEWNEKNAQINATRLSKKAEIDAAKTAKQVDNIVASIQWP